MGGLGGLGGLMAGMSGSGTGTAGGLGGLLGAVSGGATVPGAAGSGVGLPAGTGLLGALASLPALLPALMAMLGGQGASGQSGLHEVMNALEAQGLGHVGQSWVGNGPNLAVTAQQVEQALGSAKLSQLASQSGLPPSQVSQGVAAVLPSIVHSLTPSGQLPASGEVNQLLSGLLGQH